MNRRIGFACGLAIVALSGMWAGHAEDAPAAAEPKAILDNGEVMEFFFDPYYVDFRNVAKEEPRGRKSWRAMYVAAYRLSEATNLLFFRDDEEYMTTEEWREESLVARDAAVALGDAVKEKDIVIIRQKYEALIETCNHCHQRFEKEEPTEVAPWVVPVEPEGGAHIPGVPR